MFYLQDQNRQPLTWAIGEQPFTIIFNTKKAAERFRDAVYTIPEFNDITNLEVKELPYLPTKNLTNYIPYANGDDISLKYVGE